MPSAAVAAAQWAVDTLNAATLSMAVAAERSYVPISELEDLGDLRVTVVPDALTITPRDLAARQAFDCQTHVWLQKRTDRSADSDDALMQLAEDVALLFNGYRSGRDYRVLTIESRPAQAPGLGDSTGVFSTVITLTIRVSRS